MVFHGQSGIYYVKIKRRTRRRIRTSRLKLRARRWNFFGRVRSLAIKQYRANIWGSAKFKINFAKRLTVYYDYKKQIARVLGRGTRSLYLQGIGASTNISPFINKFLNNKFLQMRRKCFPPRLTANKKFYKTLNKKPYFRHQKNLQLFRLKTFLGNYKLHRLHLIWSTTKIKRQMFSSNLFAYRFFSRLPHLLYFAGFTSSLELARHLVRWGYVHINYFPQTNINYIVPLLTSVDLILPNFFFNICFFLLFPFHRVSVSTFLEINYKLFTLKILRMPTFSEIILPDPSFDLMFLYEILAPSLK